METIQIIRTLYGSMNSKYIQENADKIIDLLELAADKLSELSQLINDMNNDHYVDTLEFYADRCRELEEKSALQLEDFYKLVKLSPYACDYCKHCQPCMGKQCESYADGRKVEGLNGYTHDWQWSCQDLSFGDCPRLENTPCHGCINHNMQGFEYRGL